MKQETPRGIRNNNPGNIRHGDDWLGLVKEQPDPAFCCFTQPEWGIRAMAKILLNYERKYGISTLRGIIERWAPPVENNTESYIAHVAHAVGGTPEEEIDVAGILPLLIPAIIRHENGKNPYSTETIGMGIRLATTAGDRK